MAFRSTPSLLAKTSLLTLVLGSTSLLGCEAYKNLEERKAAAEEAGQNIDYSCPNGVCEDDPGSREIKEAECIAKEKGYEFYPIPIWDFEDGKALSTYSYCDDTTENFQPRGWELAKDKNFDPSAWPVDEGPNGPRCGRSNNGILHVQGGPFLEWGGGVGRSLRCMNGSKVLQGTEPGTTTNATQNAYAIDELWKYYCSDPVLGTACSETQTNETIASACPARDRKALAGEDVPAKEIALLGQTLDLSEWEGVSFWARRTPNSQAGIRVLIGDATTDDDISFIQYLVDPQAPRACERAMPCWCQDLNLPCTALNEEEVAILNSKADGNNRVLEPGEEICWDRNGDKPLDPRKEYKICGNTACGWPSSSAKSLNAAGASKTWYGTKKPIPSFRDIQFEGMKCQEFTYRGSITSGYCYDSNSDDPRLQKPPEGSQQCGDHWMYSIRLSYDWEFYTVPFTKLLQQGWAKRSYWLDLTAITMARITWDRGYADFYVDDVRFYRKKK